MGFLTSENSVSANNSNITLFSFTKALEGNCSLEKIAQIPTGNKLFSEKDSTDANGQ